MAKVLFVDDDHLTVKLLEKVAIILGHEPITSYSPLRAVEIARAQQPQLILVDMNMDEMNGLQFVKTIRGQAETADIPVVVLSADQTREDENRARAAGANAFYLKPLGLEEMEALIHQYANGKK